jgi:hypothetical protein
VIKIIGIFVERGFEVKYKDKREERGE